MGNLVSTDIDIVGQAHQYYKLALGKNFLSGRKSEHVAVVLKTNGIYFSVYIFHSEKLQ